MAPGLRVGVEANIRAEVVALNGPDDWALPYWNYFAPNEAALPPAFASPDWPDGVGDNPLFVEQRYGPDGDGDVFVPTNLVNLNALGDPAFTGVSSGGSPGFGGVSSRRTCTANTKRRTKNHRLNSVLLARSINYRNISLTAIQDQLGRRFPPGPTSLNNAEPLASPLNSQTLAPATPIHS
jgi:hypothetical protein